MAHIMEKVTYKSHYADLTNGYKNCIREESDKYETLELAQEWIKNNSHYIKTYFTKKGEASSKNPNEKEQFSIYDNNGNRWSIRSK
jgi:hypothetical protein